MSDLIYAIGDVHGRDDLLETMHARIAVDRQINHPDTPSVILHLGDYIDGGASSRDVIDRLRRGVDGFDTLCLKGNHEGMMLDCLETDDRQVWSTWLSNGGDQTAASFGLSLRFGGYDPAALAEALGTKRIAWLRTLPLHHQTGTHLFVHAGIAPGRPIEAQQEKDLLWIRGRFLESDADHGRIIVHGHTPSDAPVIRPNRICVDTGATSTGTLTSVVIGEPTGPRFLQVDGPPGVGPAPR